MRRLAMITFAFVFLREVASVAEGSRIILSYGKEMYSAPTRLSEFEEKVDETRFKGAKFWCISNSEDNRGSIKDKFPPFKLETEARNVKAPLAEGCSHHPWTWISKAKTIGKFNEKTPGMACIELPQGFEQSKKPPKDMKGSLGKALKSVNLEGNGEIENRCAKNTIEFTKGESIYAYTLCENALNSLFWIFKRKGKSWSKIDEFVVDLNCP